MNYFNTALKHSCIMHSVALEQALSLSVIRQPLTCVSVRCREDERSARSAMLCYHFTTSISNSTITYLCLSEVQGGRELGPLCDAQVLLLPELLLQRQQLLGSERCPWLPVRFVFP